MVPSYLTTALVTVPSKRPSELLKEITFSHLKDYLIARLAYSIVIELLFHAELHVSFKVNTIAF